MTAHWVIVEAGAKQEYIYDSNRMRHVVGASQLVLDSGTRWVEDACTDADGVTPVQLVSGHAVLLASTGDAGRAVIRAVTRQALDEAPGLEVTGAVGPAFDETALYRVGSSDDPTGPPADHVAALRRTFTVQARARAARPARQLRDPRLPWHEPCRETGLPAAGLERFGTGEDTWHPASAATLARAVARRAPRTKERLRKLLGLHRELLPNMVDDLTDDGWIAVIHADGNGVGSLMQNFPDRVAEATGSVQVSLDTHIAWLRRFSERLEVVTEEAFAAAVTTAVARARADNPGWSVKKRLLPILLGGDDVTVACHAGLALPLVGAFLREFARRTRADETIRAIAGAGGMSAAAGVAIVKRHHPFSAAYDLAEDLTASAKNNAVRRARSGADGATGDVASGGGGGGQAGSSGVHDVQVSAYDVHVAHESTLRDLQTLRRDLVVDIHGKTPVARHGGPYVVAVDDATVPAVLAHRDERHLLDTMDLLASGTLSSARAHDLRGALDRGVDEYQARAEVALARVAREHAHREDPFDGVRVKDLLAVIPDGDDDGDERMQPTHADDQPRAFVRLPDALLLHGVLPRSPDRAGHGSADTDLNTPEVAR